MNVPMTWYVDTILPAATGKLECTVGCCREEARRTITKVLCNNNNTQENDINTKCCKHYQQQQEQATAMPLLVRLAGVVAQKDLSSHLPTAI
jgi:hypothetical protein